ncbi:MAG: hypothetical protein QG597_3774 [Actinomycetota bacterium]|nr:hypothetical protein [Actinomycetota bacterium]
MSGVRWQLNLTFRRGSVSGSPLRRFAVSFTGLGFASLLRNGRAGNGYIRQECLMAVK